MRERPERVLVVRTGAIGDVVNALALASALGAAWPGVRVGWVVHDLARPLVEGHPDVARVHRWDRSGGPGELRRLVRELRAEPYDVALDLQRIAKSALVARLSGAPRVVGFDRARTKELSWLLTRERLPRPAAGERERADPRARHMLDGYLDFARYLGIEAPEVRHRFPHDPVAEHAAARLVEALGAAPVVVSTGATKPANRWAPERFAALSTALAAELGRPVLLSGAAGERAWLEPAWRAAGFAPQTAEAALTAKVAGAVPAATGGGPPVFDLVGRTDLRELSALLARAALFVGCDTGPMHLAVARGAPVVALFGPADPRRTGPYGGAAAGHRVVRAASGRMEDLAVEDALRAARELVPVERRAGRRGR